MARERFVNRPCLWHLLYVVVVLAYIGAAAPGFVPTKVAKATISRVLPTRSFVAHASLSPDQLMVLYLVDGVFLHVIVSPTPRMEFLDALMESTGLVKEALVGLGPPPSSPLPRA